MQQFKKMAELDPLTKSMSTNYLKLILLITISRKYKQKPFVLGKRFLPIWMYIVRYRKAFLDLGSTMYLVNSNNW